MLNKISLRLRVTLLCALCLAAICIVLTVCLFLNATATFVLPAAGISKGMENIEINMSLAQKSFAVQSLFLMVGFVLLGVGLIWYVAGSALCPLANLAKDIEKIDEDSLEAPLPLPESRDEITKLTVSFNKMLSRLNSAYLGQKTFAQHAAHELKTPVAAILATTEVLKMDEAPSIDEYEEAIVSITSSSCQMKKLVEDLLLLNTVLNPMDFSDISFSEIAEELKAEFAPYLQERNISFSLKGEANLHGNRPLLTRAFANLIHNAIRYNVEGGQIDIIAQASSITIRDTGIGIPQDMLAKVFDPFYCVDPSRSRTLGGSGLGLGIVKRILDEHKMSVEITSEKGTSVFVKW